LNWGLTAPSRQV